MRTRKTQRAEIILPSDEAIAALRKKIKQFPPHDIRGLMGEAKAANPGDPDEEFFRLYRSRNDEHMKSLLISLGIDPLLPDAFKRGFFKLAHIHYGLGQIALYPARKSRGSTTWDDQTEFELVREVFVRTSRGMSERKAVEEIGADPKLAKRFPYRPKTHGSQRSEKKNRESALRARFQSIKKRPPKESALSRALGLDPENLSPLERVLLDFEAAHFLSGLPEPKGGISKDT